MNVNGRKIIGKISIYLLVALIIICLPQFNTSYSKHHYDSIQSGDSVLLTEIKRIYPQTETIKDGSHGNLLAEDSNGNMLGNIVVSTDYIDENYGYAGNVHVIIALNNHNQIDSILIMPNSESKGFLRKIVKSGFYAQWTGKDIASLSKNDIETVSGATLTSGAVVRAVNASINGYLQINSVSSGIDLYSTIKVVLFALIIMLSLVMSYVRGMNRYRMWYLIIVVAISGVMLQQMLSIAMFDGWLKNGVSLSASWSSVILLLLALIMSVLGKTRYYCTYLCPMGALQELIGRWSPIKTKRLLKLPKIKALTISDLYIIVIIGTMFSNFDIDFTYWEPFAAFAVQSAPWAIIVFAIIILIASLFYTRPWCSICPTGCLLKRTELPKITSKNK